MKSVKKIATVVASAFISVCFIAGCGKTVEVDNGGLMQDINVKPTQSAAYETYTKQALDEYFAVADKHTDEFGDIDYENKDVADAAKPVAAKLFAYACYNERTIDKYAFFSAQEGYTDISSGSATALRQEYYLRVNETENTCGYRYHYTIKWVERSEGAISMFKGAFESARTRMTTDTDLLYRFEGSNIRVGKRNDVLGVDMLECDWKTGSDWGKHDLEIKKGDYIEPDAIRDDIESVAGEDNITMRANINILADDIVQSAIIMRDTNDEGEQEGYVIFMAVNTEVANKDEASLKMLRKANGSDDCKWVGEEGDSGLSIVFRIWENGLFRMYSVSEKWQGKISGFSGTADSSTVYNYSYSDRDCDMTQYLKMLDDAKAAKGE